MSDGPGSGRRDDEDAPTPSAGEARLAFLLALSDALLPLDDPGAIKAVSARLMGERLRADRAYHVEIRLGEDVAVVEHDYGRDGLASVSRRYALSDFPWVVPLYGAGRPVVVPDLMTTPIVPEAERGGLAGIHLAWIAVPLVKGGELVGAFCVAQSAPRAWTEAEVALVGDVAERLWAAVERARAGQVRRDGDGQAILLAEQHRVRNILSNVRSLVRRTTDGAGSVTGMSELLDGRLGALARILTLLVRAEKAGVDLEVLIREELLAQAADDARVAIEGPPLLLAPKAAEVLALTIHELAANALRYGALRERDGRLGIRWDVEEEAGALWLRFAWAESGVRTVGPEPRREGFGMELVTRRVPYELAGRGAFELRPGGVHCRIEFPLVPGESIVVPGEAPARPADDSPGGDRLH